MAEETPAPVPHQLYVTSLETVGPLLGQSYVQVTCTNCGALLMKSAEDLHDLWHALLDKRQELVEAMLDKTGR